MTDYEIDLFINSYIGTALWSSPDDNDEYLDANYLIYDLAPETLQKIREDCAEFLSKADSIIQDQPGIYSRNLELAGHDFWLTRNHHGAGFWDGDWEEGDKLTEIAQSFGEVDLYVGDDGKIYQG